MIRLRTLRLWALTLAALALIAILAVSWTLRSAWFHDLVRERIVREIADATGGRVTLYSFGFDWRRLRAQAFGLTIAGKEPPGKPPLFYADSVVVGLKIVSLWKRDIDIQSLEVQQPRVYLIVNADGSTNIPEPKVKRVSGSPLDAVLKLAIGRFQVRNGIFEVESRGKWPFNLNGRNLNAGLDYNRAGPSYRGRISVERIALDGTPYRLNGSLTADVSFEKDRIAIASARLATGDSILQASGALENLAAPRARLRFDTRVAVADAGRILNERLLDRGTVELAGTARWDGGSQFALDGRLHAYNVEYRGAYVRLRGFRADGTLSAAPNRLAIAGLRLSGAAGGVPVAGEISSVQFRGDDLALNGIALSGLGGSFRGNAGLRGFSHFNVAGQIAGIEARRAVALYSPVALPWNSLVSGDVKLEGLLQRRNELRGAGDLVLDPAPDSAPVHGRIQAAYDARTGLLDLSHSTLELPNSRAEFSGAVGRQLQVRLETTDLNDLLPAIGRGAQSLPLKLDHGGITFGGTVIGPLDNPEAAGHVTATNLAYDSQKLDSFAGDVDVSARNAAVRNGSLARGRLRAKFEGAVELHNWVVENSSLISGSGTLSDASIADLASELKLQTFPASGDLTAALQINGTVGNPIGKADIVAVKGALLDQPFDRFNAHLDYANRTLSMTGAQLVAGPKQLNLDASYQHAEHSLENGRLRFQLHTNEMKLTSIDAVHNEWPDAQGLVRASANGTLEAAPPKHGEPLFRISDLHVDVVAQGLHFSSQPLGNAHLTANSEGQILRAHVDSAIAGTTVKGDGEWRLEGDYPGGATIAFSRLDFSQLRPWLPPSSAGVTDHVHGWAEGQFHFQGPALQPQAIKGELRIPTFEIGASTGEAAGPSLTLRNSGPIVATIANSTLTVDSMRLVGHDSDLGVTGKISLSQNTSDLHVNGRVDLAIVHDFNPDFRASGVVTADATVRGSLNSPSVTGRTEFHNATLYVADLPNGLSNANGVIVFAGGRATIQSLSGETGGGKVQLNGFAAYENGQTIFRIHARVDTVRVRYPEGVSSVSNASLNLTGSVERSMLSGTVTVVRLGFNPQTDFSSVMAASAQPVQTVSARTGFLGGMSFDIQINTAPDIEFQSSLTQDLQVDANLRLRGSFSNPALLGRINLTQGRLEFFGTRYTINEGSISFYNPARIDPIFDLSLETKARGIDITLSITGPLNKLTLTPRSDPPLQFNEIVALLATGRTPTNDPTMLFQQSTAPQSWQQIGASALLGQAISSPVAGRLQRFFGVSQFRIDPSLPGVESAATARITLEQQVTQDITFTYITNVTTSNPQVVRVEWAFAKQWSVVAIRDENGIFGIDFYLKKRF